MATRKKKIDEITTLASHLEECPLFDIKHLKHKSLDGFIKHPENFYLKSRYMSLSVRQFLNFLIQLNLTPHSHLVHVITVFLEVLLRFLLGQLMNRIKF